MFVLIVCDGVFICLLLMFRNLFCGIVFGVFILVLILDGVKILDLVFFFVVFLEVGLVGIG